MIALYSCQSRTKVTPGRVSSRGTVVQSGVGRLTTGVLAAVANSRLARASSSRVSGSGQANRNLRSPHVLGDCGPADPYTLGNLAAAQTTSPFET